MRRSCLRARISQTSAILTDKPFGGQHCLLPNANFACATKIKCVRDVKLSLYRRKAHFMRYHDTSNNVSRFEWLSNIKWQWRSDGRKSKPNTNHDKLKVLKSSKIKVMSTCVLCFFMCSSCLCVGKSFSIYVFFTIELTLEMLTYISNLYNWLNCNEQCPWLRAA